METGCFEYGGQIYKTVKIGTQTWMAENLNYAVGGSKCYDNNPANCATYGRLYTWDAAMTACPVGWHLPNNRDWDVLVNYTGGFLTTGAALKATSGWHFEGNGTNSYGFSALPGGVGRLDGSFDLIGNYGYWWSATDGNNINAYSYNNADAYIMHYLISDVYKGNLYKFDMLSVRYIRDSS